MVKWSLFNKMIAMIALRSSSAKIMRPKRFSWRPVPSASSMRGSKSSCACARRATGARWRTKCAISCARRLRLACWKRRLLRCRAVPARRLPLRRRASRITRRQDAVAGGEHAEHGSHREHGSRRPHRQCSGDAHAGQRCRHLEPFRLRSPHQPDD